MKIIPLTLAAVLLTTVQKVSGQIQVTEGRTWHCTKFYGREQYFCGQYDAGSQEQADCELFKSGQIIRSTMQLCGYRDEEQDPDSLKVDIGPDVRHPPPPEGEPWDILPPEDRAPELIGVTPPPTPTTPPRLPGERTLPGETEMEPPLRRGLYDLDVLKGR